MVRDQIYHFPPKQRLILSIVAAIRREVDVYYLDTSVTVRQARHIANSGILPYRIPYRNILHGARRQTSHYPRSLAATDHKVLPRLVPSRIYRVADEQLADILAPKAYLRLNQSRGPTPAGLLPLTFDRALKAVGKIGNAVLRTETRPFRLRRAKELGLR